MTQQTLQEIIINRDQRFNIPSLFLQQAKRFREMMLLYECAVDEITTKLNILDKELGFVSQRNPISAIKSRVKRPQSIVDKLIRDEKPVNVESVRENLNDVAGVRVICSYIDDIFALAEMIKKQDDIRIIEVKDYITHPKDNGYRSLHMIVEIPVFLSSGKEYVRVEIQIRTIAMDFWASLEHEIRYKKSHKHLESVAEALMDCANTIAETDQKMLDIRSLIDDGDEKHEE